MFQHGSACYETAQQANQAQASSLVGSIVQVGGMPYAVNISGVGDTQITYTLENLAGPGTITKAVTVSPQACGLLQVEDAITIGWGIGGAWIGAFCLMFLARVIRDSIQGSSDYGNS